MLKNDGFVASAAEVLWNYMDYYDTNRLKKQTESAGVTVKKDGDDKSETLEVKNGQVNLATFTNSYAAKGSVTLAAKKRFTGGALAGNDFSFALYKGDKAEGTPIETVTNDEKGNITFQPINYTEAGDYEYTIKEVTGINLYTRFVGIYFQSNTAFR